MIPKEHAEKIYELSAGGSTALINSVKHVAKAISQALDCDFNVLNNNGKLSGQAVNHVHFHIIPRTGSEGFSMKWPEGKYDEGESEEIIKNIKERL